MSIPENRVVCYLTTHYGQSTSENGTKTKIENSLVRMARSIDDFTEADKNEYAVENMILFKDGILFSYKLSQNRTDLIDLFCVLYHISEFVCQLMTLGVFTRGGLTYGPISIQNINKGSRIINNKLHKQSYSAECSGKGYVQAVLLESQAVYPRVLIDPLFFDEKSECSIYYNRDIIKENRDYIENKFVYPELSEEIKSELKDHPDSSLDISEILENWKTDVRMVRFLDVFNRLDEMSDNDRLAIKNQIENELETNQMVWLKNYYNKRNHHVPV